MGIGKGNRNIRRKPAWAPLCPPQILHDLNWARTRPAEVGSRRLTAWAGMIVSNESLRYGRKIWKETEWIQTAWCGVQWRAFVAAAMNLVVP
jgi:hypothetical protein